VIEKEQGNAIQVIHSQVRDEAAARNRLCRVGLLTTSSMQVEFPIRNCLARRAQADPCSTAGAAQLRPAPRP
jgi:hypothetical protein